MFGWMFVKNENPTEKEIHRLEVERLKYSVTSDEYARINARIKELMELKEFSEKKKFHVSGDTVVKVGAMGVLGALVVFKEELVGPVTSKALGFVSKFF